MGQFSKVACPLYPIQGLAMIEVLEATYQEGYKVWLKFNSGESGVVDLEDLLHRNKVAAPLIDKNEFRKFYLDEWPTLAWSCGFDVAPESLYERLTGKRPDWQQTETVHEVLEEYK